MGLRASKAVEIVKDALSNATDEDGNYASGEIVREAFERMGHDGIIDNTVNRKFGTESGRKPSMSGVDKGTVHYITFEPNQIKSALGNRGTFDAANPDILYSRSWRKALEGVDKKLPREEQEKAVNLAKRASAVGIIEGHEKLDLGKKPSVFDVATALDKRAAQIHWVDGYTPFNREYLAQAMLDEVRYQLGRDDSAMGWYEAKVNEAMGYISDLFPELKDDSGKMAVFKAILAVTSNGTDVNTNMLNAVSLYDGYRNTGKIDSSRTFSGTRSREIQSSLKKIQALIDDTGESGLRDFLDKEMTAAELRATGYGKLAGEPSDFKVRGAMILMVT